MEKFNHQEEYAKSLQTQISEKVKLKIEKKQMGKLLFVVKPVEKLEESKLLEYSLVHDPFGKMG